MIKKVMAAAAIAASVVGASAAAAPHALAADDDNSVNTTNDDSSQQSYGNLATHGNMSPQMALVQGSLNKPCVGVPAKAGAASLVGLVPVAVEDVPVLSPSSNQQCAENSTQIEGDDALSPLLDDAR
ncbi:rodlin [Streptomyces cavernae]|uniref:rodlin n=1 Tax=Streptomyces cavernae TaxID=2259034 RepID=UPI000FEB8198|nr:rodlin [Streptomyces cavernae]